MEDEELLIAIANTAHGEGDELADGRSVRRWWRALGGAGAARPASAEAVAVLRDLRAVIRALALRNNGIDARVDGAGLAGLTLRPDLGGGVPGLRAEGRGDLARDIGAATVAALLRASGRPSWPRLKACRGEGCRWVFLDGSRNTSRRWCDMAACGNRAKSTSFRSRHRSTTEA
ncbi:CGNR zinc finger domain-containing protein [Dactylosporangium vinaceum]|uniref:CGNR zinc finger domain-containing protein n=1 Tax=Dactylosporangium vinaceum TaxID=53362 RepID=A0ABV5MK09_9ACTN|nr:CGNR zinc finger domain-containing protein [Dactylosporangium vinaceum]